MFNDSLTGRVFRDMDPDLLEFLNSYIDTFVKWDLLSFFYNNPHTIDTVDNIARYAGRDEETVQQELTGLAAKGLLEETKMGELVVYALTPNLKIRDQLSRFVEASEDRQFRIRAIYHVIKNMREE
ncbi:MAG: hypothetical protein RBT47_06705 [Anaerolineae bacterium]|nr:hypothetical protein [Anaerolineae bacterium]